MEILLLRALFGRKPIGLKKHFVLCAICKDFNAASPVQISSEALVQKLETMYNFDAIPPLNDEVIQHDFSLPYDPEFLNIVSQRENSEALLRSLDWGRRSTVVSVITTPTENSSDSGFNSDDSNSPQTRTDPKKTPLAKGRRASTRLKRRH